MESLVRSPFPVELLPHPPLRHIAYPRLHVYSRSKITPVARVIFRPGRLSFSLCPAGGVFAQMRIRRVLQPGGGCGHLLAFVDMGWVNIIAWLQVMVVLTVSDFLTRT